MKRRGTGVGLHVGDTEIRVARYNGDEVVIQEQPALMALVEPEVLSGTPWGESDVRYSGEAMLVGKAVEQARQLPAVEAHLMRCGRLDIHRPAAEFALARLLEEILGPAMSTGQPCVVAEPSPAIGLSREPLFHAAVLQDVVRKLGYSPSGLEEGRAAALAENANGEVNMLAFSCDHRLVQGYLSCRGILGFGFSMDPGAGWVDDQVAMALEVSLDEAKRIREGCWRVLIPENRSEEALQIYSRAYVQRMWKRLNKFLDEQGPPLFNSPVDAVWAGTWRMPGDFGDMLLREARGTGFCVPLRSIRCPQDGTTAVARGCLEMARRLDMEIGAGRSV